MSVNVFAGQADLASPNDPLVGFDDFVESFNIPGPISASDTARINTALEIASAAVRTRTAQQLSVVTETITLDASGNTRLVLPEYPVTAISAVTRDGSPLGSTAYAWHPPAGLITTLDGSRWLAPQVITVTYTHGWDPLPRDLAGVVLSKAKRWFDAPGGLDVQSQTLGSWSVTYAQTNVGGWTQEEDEILDRYTMWTVVS